MESLSFHLAQSRSGVMGGNRRDVWADFLGVDRPSSARILDVLVRPDDAWARAPDGRPLKADPNRGALRLVGFAHQCELALPAAPSQCFWLVSPISVHDMVDFEVLRERLRCDGCVAMGVVSGTRPGAGAVLLVPTSTGFALHAIERSSPTGPFERLFSQRAFTMMVEDWPERISRGRPPSARRRARTDSTALWGNAEPDVNQRMLAGNFSTDADTPLSLVSLE